MSMSVDLGGTVLSAVASTAASWLLSSVLDSSIPSLSGIDPAFCGFVGGLFGMVGYSLGFARGAASGPLSRWFGRRRIEKARREAVSQVVRSCTPRCLAVLRKASREGCVVLPMWDADAQFLCDSGILVENAVDFERSRFAVDPFVADDVRAVICG